MNAICVRGALVVGYGELNSVDAGSLVDVFDGRCAIDGGGVVPKVDRESLSTLGVAAFFGPGTPILEAARKVLDLLPKPQDND